MWNFFLGYVTISVKGLSLESLLDKLNKNNIVLRDIKRFSRNYIIFKIPWTKRNQVKRIIDDNGYSCKAKAKGIANGIISLLIRPVLVVGILVIAAALIMADYFVFSIDYIGDMSREVYNKVITTSREIGIYQGAYKKNWDIDEMEYHIIKEVDELIFVSIHVDGSYIIVEAVEAKTHKSDISRDDIADIVAIKSCMINKMNVYNGYPLVKEGDIVKRGQVLVSAAVPIKNETDVMYTGALADIQGRVWYTNSYTVSLFDTIVTQTGNEDKGIEIYFSDKVVYKTDTSFIEYNVDKKSIELMKGIWPITFVINYYTEIKTSIIELDEMQVITKAKALALSGGLAMISEDADILNKSVNLTENNDIIKATATIETLEEIGVRVLINSKGDIIE